MYLDDVEVNQTENGATVSYRGTVATVQPNAATARRIALAEERARWAPNEKAKVKARQALDHIAQDDAWSYTLPPNLNPFKPAAEDGSITLSHPTKAGAIHMARKAFVEAGIITVPHDNAHLDEVDRAIAGRLEDSREMMPGARVGDYARHPSGRVQRICGFGGSSIGKAGEPDTRVGLTDGGSYALPRLRKPASGAVGASYSGGLSWDDAWTLGRLSDSGERVKGRFWFFSHGQPGAGRGVDCALTCRVFDIAGDLEEESEV